jgi:hypothetical protein
MSESITCPRCGHSFEPTALMAFAPDAGEELWVGQVDRDARADLPAPDREAAVDGAVQLEAQVGPGDRRAFEPAAEGAALLRGQRRRRQ